MAPALYHDKRYHEEKPIYFLFGIIGTNNRKELKINSGRKVSPE
jgi:hypothetical protein